MEFYIVRCVNVMCIAVALGAAGGASAADFQCKKEFNGEKLRMSFPSEGDPKDLNFPFPEGDRYRIDKFDKNEPRYLVCYYGHNPEPAIVIKLPDDIKYCIAEKPEEPIVCR